MGLKPIRVGQLNNYIGRVLKTDPILGNVSVIGEISNLKFHSSGHVYFSLKDETSKVNCFLAASNLERITCPMEEGMEIIASGYISVYERGGYYSLNIRDVEVNGEGQLAVQFEKLKAKLEKEGLFAAENKKPLPVFPSKIAVVTSETGAAVRDIIRTIKNKNDYVDILVYPVLVQGPAAAKDIADAITDINENYKDIDIIITGRGGGSMEELWAFNEEIVARSIFASDIPVISAVGHETDFTISDFTADYRAATPTAAAEMAVPDTGEIRQSLEEMKENLAASLIQSIELRKNRLSALDPNAFANGITTRIAYEQMNADRIIESMGEHLKNRIASGKERIELLRALIDAADPKGILARGYSVVTDEEGNVISRSNQLKIGQNVTIETGSGTAGAEITSVN
ncbi:MAG: exodeoxyribonuclease VII large subunit [Clostridiales bacterium]|nr:exodeoxyribonuclease VII large subunit [Clostridiales bacterium]